MKAVETMMVFDVMQLKHKYKEFDEWFDAHAEIGDIVNSCGKKFYVNETDEYDSENEYEVMAQKLDAILIKDFGVSHGECVIFWISW